MEHLELVARLASARIGRTFNQYAGSELRRRRLETYLAEREKEGLRAAFATIPPRRATRAPFL